MSAAPQTWLDRAIGWIAPGVQLERMKARVLLGYDAANPGHRRQGGGGQAANASPENWQLQRDRVKLMWEARAGERNVGLIGGILDRMTQYVVGALSYQPNTGDKTIDAAYAEYFHEWCGRADLSGRFRLRKLVEMGFRAMLRDGDYGFVLSRHGGEVRLQGVEADRLGKPDDVTPDERYIGGITINDLGQPVSYRVYERTTLGQYVNPQEFTASQFLHLWNPLRGDQYRGVSWIQPAIPAARDLQEWFNAEMTRAKFHSKFAGFVTGKNYFTGQGAAEWDAKTSEGTPTMKVQDGTLVRLREGEGVSFPPPMSNPSGAFLSFVDVRIRHLAVALNAPYGFLYDLTALGGVTARLEVQQAQRLIAYFQGLLVDCVLERIKDEVLALGMATGQLPASQFWRRGRWQFGPWITADLGYQTQADVELMQMGLKTGTQIVGEQGGTFSEVAQQIISEVKELQEMAALAGVPIELIAPNRAPAASQLLASMNTPPSPPSGMMEAMGEGASKQLIEILEKASTGEMERDAAVQALVEIFGMSEQRAEAIVPKRANPAVGYEAKNGAGRGISPGRGTLARN